MSMRKRTPEDEADSWDRWLAKYRRRLQAIGQAKSTLESVERRLRQFFKYAEVARVRGPRTATPELLRSYLVYLREAPHAGGRKYSPATVNLHSIILRGFFEYLAGEGWVSSRLAQAIELVKVPDLLPRDIPTDSEVDRMIRTADLSTATGYRDRAILEMLYSTAIRRQELVDLKPEDVDFERGYVRIECGKGGKGRVVPLGRKAGEWVKRYLLLVRPELLRGRADGGALFLSKSGKKMEGNDIRETVARARERAGIQKKVTPHALRRACATEMIRRHANAYLVKELLGHKDFSSMDVYARLTIVDLKKAHRRFHPRERKSPG